MQQRFGVAADAHACRILEVVHTAFCIQFCYAYIIHGFADFTGLNNINWYVFKLPRNVPPSQTMFHHRGVGVSAACFDEVDGRCHSPACPNM